MIRDKLFSDLCEGLDKVICLAESYMSDYPKLTDKMWEHYLAVSYHTHQLLEDAIRMDDGYMEASERLAHVTHFFYTWHQAGDIALSGDIRDQNADIRYLRDRLELWRCEGG